MSREVCPLCAGEKHVLRPDGVWVRCSCLEQEIHNQRIIEAGIYFPEDTLNLLNIGSEFPGVDVSTLATSFVTSCIDNLKKPVAMFPVYPICFSGSPTGPKDFLTQMILLEAVKRGYTVGQYTMEQVIFSMFDKNSQQVPLEKLFCKHDIMCVSFGTESQFNVAGSLLTELARLSCSRLPSYLILNTNLSWGDLTDKYGNAVQNLFVHYINITSKKERRFAFIEVES